MTWRERIASWFDWRVKPPEPMRDSVQDILEDFVYLGSAFDEELTKLKRRARALQEEQPDCIGDIAITVAQKEATDAAMAMSKAAEKARGSLALYRDAGVQVSAAGVKR